MIVLRLFRIGVIALTLSAAVAWSQRETMARSGETVPGIAWALGTLSLVFLLSAFAAERTRRFESALPKDLLWGLGTGGLIAVMGLSAG